jgi:hypothetical protein
MDPTAVFNVLELYALALKMKPEAEAEAQIYRLIWVEHWRPDPFDMGKLM